MYSCWVFDIYSCEINIQYAKTDWFFSLLQALVLGHLHGGEAHHVQHNVWGEEVIGLRIIILWKRL